VNTIFRPYLITLFAYLKNT